MLTYSILQTNLHHLTYEVSAHMCRFAEEGSSRNGRVEFDNAAKLRIFHLSPKPIIAIDFRVHAQCFWNHISYCLYSDCIWDCFPELSQDGRACIKGLIGMAL